VGGAKTRYTFLIEPEILEQLRSIADRTGVPVSEQIREGTRWWLESRTWPPLSHGASARAGRSPRLSRDSVKQR
jgi:hypothetical protein